MEADYFRHALSDDEWDRVRGLIGPAPTGRPRTTDLRAVIDAALLATRGGVRWRDLPRSFPPWPTVYSAYRRWNLEGRWAAIEHALGSERRRAFGGVCIPHFTIRELCRRLDLDPADARSVLSATAGDRRSEREAGRRHRRLSGADAFKFAVAVSLVAAGMRGRLAAESVGRADRIGDPGGRDGVPPGEGNFAYFSRFSLPPYFEIADARLFRFRYPDAQSGDRRTDSEPAWIDSASNSAVPGVRPRVVVRADLPGIRRRLVPEADTVSIF